MATRRCQVSFRDHKSITHSVEVEADTLYEAAVIATVRFKQDPWLERVTEHTTLQIEVREPGTKHTLTLASVEKWLQGHGTPADQARRARLKAMLVMGR